MILKELTSILSKMNNFHSLEVVDRVSETQLQVGENVAVKGLTTTPKNYSIIKHSVATYMNMVSGMV